MNAEQPSRPDPDQTIRRRRPETPDPLTPSTQHLDYTPDMLPDVPVYEAKRPRSGWWWAVVVGGLALLVVALAVGVVLWVRGNADLPAGALMPW